MPAEPADQFGDVEELLKETQRAMSDQLPWRSICEVVHLVNSAALRLEDTLNTILDHIVRLTGAERGFIVVADQRLRGVVGEVEIEVSRDAQGGEVPPEDRQVPRTVIHQAIASGEPVVWSAEEALEQPVSSDSVDRIGVTAYMCVPLKLRQEIASPDKAERRSSSCFRFLRRGSIGAVYVDFRQKYAPDAPFPAAARFTEEKLQILRILADQATIALLNSMLYHQATRDHLTSLYNRRYFESKLREEIGFAETEGSSLSLLMLDLDGFKQINDRFGHPVGDLVLEQIGKLLNTGTRINDIAARYGGEEFAVLLPATKGQDALLVAEKLRSLVERISVSPHPLKCQVSIGVACYPDDATLPEDLVKRADQALFAVKSKGGNQVVAWNTALGRVGGRSDALAGLFSGDSARDYRNISAFVKAITAAAGASDPNAVLGSALDYVLDATGADRAAIMLLDDMGELHVSRAKLRTGEEIASFDGYSRSVPSHAMKHVTSVIRQEMDDGRRIPTRPDDTVHLLCLRTVISVPLIAAGKTVGVIYTDSKASGRPMGTAEVMFLEAVASHIAMAFQNARMAQAWKTSIEEKSRQLEEENVKLRRLLEGEIQIVGASPAIENVLNQVRKVASTDVSVLVTGETGTGKESIARLIHEMSGRARGPFVVVNCGAIPENLLESELFGHEKGAFTSAHERHIGKFERASAGTLFLDEIGELQKHLQAKLLRVLESGVVERVGGTAPIPVGVRLVVATNKDLSQMVQQGSLREDLFFRLKVVTIPLPPLRERGEDTVLLAKSFLDEFCQKYGKGQMGFTPLARRAMLSYAWPGNVRELKHRIQQAVVMGEGDRIDADDLGLSPRRDTTIVLDDVVRAAKKNAVLEAMRRTENNVTEASKQLGVSRQHLYRLMEELGIQ